VKIVLFLVFTGLAIAGAWYVSLGALVALVVSGKLFGNIPAFVLLKGTARVMPFILIMVLFQFVFKWSNDASAVLFAPFKDSGNAFLSYFSITEAEARRSVGLVCRIAAIIAALSLYIVVTPLREILSGIRAALAPLSRIGLPARDIAMTAGISLRFVPVLTEEADRIVTAQLSRGGKRSLRGAVAMIIPLFLRALDRAETLSVSMLLRLYKPSA
jgi:energy-coupling factor transport system permease protein